MAYILHIDISSEKCTGALARDGKVLISCDTEKKERNSAATINIIIKAILLAERVNISDLSAVAVIGGPGSYTGLRIGLSTAKGICYALDKPIILHNKLDLLALEKCSEYGDSYSYYLTVLPARAKEYFACMYNYKREVVFASSHIEEGALLELIKHPNLLVTGVLEQAIVDVLNNDNIKFIENTEIDFAFWANLTLESYNCNNFSDLANSEPFYLKQVYTHKKL
ncbi:MAG TPA: tRNA (adenosine(37)-N6)-threonylcarbamoyltransferase complex dimerization subunit type 1 TsaB [Flavipsychrobacter sp.]|jgi:tRNA threonylcarbamoyladenosine biosynthesis protein TsaB|nr:tRNA (adenosine(37)-N6)-threonylcarbamoyltransferase complex dimerization subunit type 1 TsaB [Flavipsychrobacter sp.]